MNLLDISKRLYSKELGLLEMWSEVAEETCKLARKTQLEWLSTPKVLQENEIFRQNERNLKKMMVTNYATIDLCL